MIVIPDDASPAERKAAESYVQKISALFKEKLGVDLQPRVVTRSKNGRGRAATIHTEPFAVTDSRAVKYFTSDEGLKAHASILRDTLGKIPGVQFSIPHNPARGDNGAHGNGTNEVALARKLIGALRGATVSSQTGAGQSVNGILREALVKRLPSLEQTAQKFRAELAERQRQQLIYQGWITGNIKMNRYSKDDTDLADNMAQASGIGAVILNGPLSSPSGDMQMMGGGDEVEDPAVANQVWNPPVTKQAAAAAIYQEAVQLNYVAKPYRSSLHTMAMSPDPANQIVAYELLGNIQRTSPNAVDGLDGDLVKRAQIYTSLTTGVGALSSADAVKEIARMNSPEFKAEREKMKDVIAKEMRETLSAVTADGLAGQLDVVPDGLSSDPLNPRRAPAIVAEYKERLGHWFQETGGNKVLAEKLALGDMLKVYGMSKVTGSGRTMRFPPERFYPPIGKDGHKYLQEDLKNTAEAAIKERMKTDPRFAAFASQADKFKVDPNKIFLEFIPRVTEGQISRGEPPGYMVYYIDERSGLFIDLGRQWRMNQRDIDAVRADAKRKFDERRLAIEQNNATSMKPDRVLRRSMYQLNQMISPDGPEKDAARERFMGRIRESEELNRQAVRESAERRQQSSAQNQQAREPDSEPESSDRTGQFAINPNPPSAPRQSVSLSRQQNIEIDELSDLENAVSLYDKGQSPWKTDVFRKKAIERIKELRNKHREILVPGIYSRTKIKGIDF